MTTVVVVDATTITGGKAGATASVKFRVTDAGGYVAILQYAFLEHDQADRARMWKLAGGNHKEAPGGGWVEPGAPLQIKVTFARVDGSNANRIKEQTVENPRLSYYGATTLNAILAGMI